jgi:hypothetical protein
MVVINQPLQHPLRQPTALSVAHANDGTLAAGFMRHARQVGAQDTAKNAKMRAFARMAPASPKPRT